ncbi:MAG: secretin N-terminal domain-containing protein [Myxococcota bacterium]|nr:secretin N-terminal domain-containing protein [Myxococcota bacterium]
MLVLCAASGVAGAQPREPVVAPAKIYGLEVEHHRGRDRLLVFGAGQLRYRLTEVDSERLLLVLPRAALEEGTPTRVAPRKPGAIVEVTVREVLGAVAPEVHVEVRRVAGAEPDVQQEGAMLALSFEGLEAPPEVIALPFENEELPVVVETIARAVGETFLYDEKLQGRVTIALAAPVTLPEARAILDSVLLLERFAAVPTPSGAFRVLPIRDAHAEAPWKTDALGEEEAPVTTLLRLEAAEVDSLVTQLQPWLGESALATTQAETNALILSGSEHRVRELLSIVNILDQAATEELMLRRLRHRGAAEVGELLSAAIEGEPVPSRRVQLWVDERTNALVLRGGPARLAELREWIETLDQPPQTSGVLHVRRLRHADPDTMVGLLEGLRAGGAAPEPGTPQARAQQALAGRPYSVVADGPTRSLLVQADPETYAVIAELVTELDQPPPRIHVEAMVYEVVTDSSLAVGVDAFLPVSDVDDSDDVIANIFLDPTGSGLFQPGAGSADAPSFGARYTKEPVVVPIVDEDGNPIDLIIPRTTVVLLSDQRQVHGRVLLQPHIFAVSGEEHELNAGDNIPVRQAAISDTGGGALQNQINIQRQDVGVRLRITPTLGQGGRVRLTLDIETTRLAPSLAGNPEVVGPTIRQRRVESTFWLADDEVAVVGMGHFPEFAELERGTPWLKNIPLIGHAFRAYERRQMKAHLVVTAQVRVQHDDLDVLAETIRRRLALERVLSRQGELDPQDGPYALRVATRRQGSDAEVIASSFGLQGQKTRVLRWEGEGGDARFDVYLVGFETVGAVSEAALRARDGGWTPELVVVPEARPS